MTGAPFTHSGQGGFDDIDGTEEVGFELIAYKSLGPTGSGKLFDSANDGFARAAEEDVELSEC